MPGWTKAGLPWYFEFGYPDLRISDVLTNDGIDVVVEMVGNQTVPVAIKIIFEDDSVQEIYVTAGIWRDQKRKTKFHFNSDKRIKKIELGNSRIPDVNPENNVWEL